jgi:CubicO group peptidase (beta-lactamase class C family)
VRRCPAYGTRLEIALAATLRDMLITALLTLALTASPAFQEAPAVPALSPLCELLDDTASADANALVTGGLAPGMVIGVVRGDETCIRAFGEVALGSSAAPDAETVYEIGSISKVFTGVLLADAEQRGTLSIDATVQSFYPEEFELDQVGDTPIRLRDLVTHSSGLPRMPTNFAPVNPDNPYADYGFEQLFDFLDGYATKRAPGERYAYSNLGAALLGDAVARSQHSAYETLVKTRITDPLGMRDTSIELSDNMREHFAPGYDVDQHPRSSWEFLSMAPAGGIRSNMNDMLVFARAALHPPEGPVGKALTRSMTTLYRSPQDVDLAFGWHVASGGATFWHNGQTGGYHSFIAIIPGADAAVVVLSNTTTGFIDVLGDNLVRVLMGAEARKIEFPTAIELTAEAAAEYVGRYKLNLLSSLTITYENERLYAQITTQPAARIYPSAKDRCFYRAVPAELVFERGEDGKISGLVLLQDGNETKARRVE